MKKNRICLSLILFIIIIITINITTSQNSQIIRDKRFNYEFLNNGMIKIDKDSKILSYFGFGLTGEIGEISRIFTSDNFNWALTQDGNRIIISNDNSTLPINATFNFLPNGNIKIEHNIQNKFVTDINNLKFWYYFMVPENTTIRYNATSFVPKIKDTMTINIPQQIAMPRNYQILSVGDNRIDFADLVYNGFNITNLYYGNGSILNRPSDIIVALAVTDGDTFIKDQVLSLDPTLSTTDFLDPTLTQGTFTLSNNTKVSDDLYARTKTLNAYINASNFNLLQSEGGTIPNGAYIQGMDVQVESYHDCLLGDMGLTVSLSGDNGATYQVTKTISVVDLTEVYYSISRYATPETSDEGGTGIIWNTTMLSNANFKIKVQLTSSSCGLTFIYIDHLRINIGWTPPSISNITYQDLDNPKVYHLDYSATTPTINSTNIISYIPFDWNDTSTGVGGFFRYPDYHSSDLELYTGIFGAQPIINSTCLFGTCGWFNGLSSELLEATHSRFDLDSVTVNAWVYSRNFGKERTVAAFGTGDATAGANPPDWRIGMVDNTGNEGRGGFQATNSVGTILSCKSPNNFTSNSWIMITGVKNATGLYYYENGVLINGTCPLTGVLQKSNLQYSNPLLSIGASFQASIGGYSSFWNGSIDEVLVLNTALNSSQILTFYNNQTKRFYSKGEKIFYGYNIGNNNTINVSALTVQPIGTRINISVGRLSGNSYIYNNEYDFSTGDISGLLIETPQNFSIKFIFYSGANQYLTPILNESFSVVSYNKTHYLNVVGYRDCDWLYSEVINAGLGYDCGNPNYTKCIALNVNLNITNNSILSLNSSCNAVFDSTRNSEYSFSVHGQLNLTGANITSKSPLKKFDFLSFVSLPISRGSYGDFSFSNFKKPTNFTDIQINFYSLSIGNETILLNSSDISLYVIAGGKLDRRFRLNVSVYASGAVVSGANVTARNVSLTIIDSKLTGSNGAAWLNLSEYVDTGSGKIGQNNYTLNVTSGGYVPSSTTINLTSDSSTSVTLTTYSTIQVSGTETLHDIFTRVNDPIVFNNLSSASRPCRYASTASINITTGNLVMESCTLEMNSSAITTYKLEVGGGRLTANYSNITRFGTDNYDFYTASSNATQVILKNSFVSYAGRSDSPNLRGLTLNTNNVTFINNTLASSSKANLDLEANNLIIEKSVFLGQGVTLYNIFVGANDSLIIDSNLSNAITKDIRFSIGTNLTLLNTNHSTEFIQTGGKLIKQWYVDVFVQNNSGSVIGGANVSFYNVTGALTHNILTNSSGNIDRQNIIEYVALSTGRVYQTNYTINVSKEGFVTQTQSLNLTSSTNLTFTLMNI